MQTVIKYQDTALPTAAVDVTLFNSVTAFPPGGSFHLLNQQWFQYALLMDSAGAATGTVVGQFSDDKGVTWNTYYTSAAHPIDVTATDEVYVGMFKDVRFMLNVGTADLTVFNANLALNDQKATSKHTLDDVLVQVVP